jgi:hypothetical protein
MASDHRGPVQVNAVTARQVPLPRSRCGALPVVLDPVERRGALPVVPDLLRGEERRRFRGECPGSKPPQCPHMIAAGLFISAQKGQAFSWPEGGKPGGASAVLVDALDPFGTDSASAIMLSPSFAIRRSFFLGARASTASVAFLLTTAQAVRHHAPARITPPCTRQCLTMATNLPHQTGQFVPRR